MQIKSNLLLLGCIGSFLMFFKNPISAQKNNNLKPEWLTFEQAVALEIEKPKPILIDIYTDWCGWCKRLDQTTYTDSTLLKYLNANFRLVKLNAETKDSIQFKDKTFKYIAEYKANSLALSLLSGKMSYPSTVFLDNQYNIITIAPGFMQAPEMLQIAQYVVQGAYKTEDFDTFKSKQKVGTAEK